MNFRHAILPLCLSLPVGAAMAQDIAGVRLGSTAAEAKAAISKANPDLAPKPLKRNDGVEVGATAISAKQVERNGAMGLLGQAGPQDEFVFMNDDKGAVYYVSRAQRLAGGSRIAEDVFVATITQKFGKPSSVMTMLASEMAWDYDRNGKLYSGASAQSPCASITWDGGRLPGMILWVPGSFNATCGKMIRVSYATNPGALVPAYDVRILEVKTMYDRLHAKEAKSEAEQKSKIEQERAKGNKPQI